jgi:hypothetical protein
VPRGGSLYCGYSRKSTKNKGNSENPVGFPVFFGENGLNFKKKPNFWPVSKTIGGRTLPFLSQKKNSTAEWRGIDP